MVEQTKEGSNILETRAEPQKRPPSRRLFIVLGILWIVLGAVIFWQLPAAVTNIQVRWVTETETDTAGFHIYRAPAPDGAAGDEDCASVSDDTYMQVNDQLITATGSAVDGDAYSWPDNSAEGSKRYCYQLEDVELNGTSERHPPIFGKARSQFDRIIYLILAPLSLVIGLGLIVSGYRGERQL